MPTPRSKDECSFGDPQIDERRVAEAASRIPSSLVPMLPSVLGMFSCLVSFREKPFFKSLLKPVDVERMPAAERLRFKFVAVKNSYAMTVPLPNGRFDIHMDLLAFEEDFEQRRTYHLVATLFHEVAHISLQVISGDKDYDFCLTVKPKGESDAAWMERGRPFGNWCRFIAKLLSSTGLKIDDLDSLPVDPNCL